MLDKLNYKQKCYLLFLGLVMFLYLGYQFSFSDTFKIVDELQEKEQKLSWLKEKEKELPMLKAKMAQFDKAYSKNDSMAVRDKLTALISDFADNNACLVTEIPTNSSFKNDNMDVQTNTFTIKGNFNNLLSLLYKLEHEHKYVAKIMSAKFYSLRDLQKKKKELYLMLVTQSFKQKI
jgi:hypothetical protein